MTRDEALAHIALSLMLLGRLTSRPDPESEEALRVLSQPCIELEGWEVVDDNEWRIGKIPPGPMDRVVILRRKV